MARAATPTTPTADLPEFLRSALLGAQVAETLDAAAESITSPAMRAAITAAATEIRDLHGLRAPVVEHPVNWSAHDDDN